MPNDGRGWRYGVARHVLKHFLQVPLWNNTCLPPHCQVTAADPDDLPARLTGRELCQPDP